MNKSILIYGAGAIGRGYLPWVFHPDEFDYYFVETNIMLRNNLNRNKSYITYKTGKGRYENRKVPLKYCYAAGEERKRIAQVDAVITAVGPRNILSIYENLKNSSTPVICFENDASLPEMLVSITNNQNIFFGIPDVITSNTAPRNLLARDPLSIVTEDGACFVDKRASHLGGDCNYVTPEELKKQWLAKLYIHNTSHCIAAYLGYLSGVKYLHEAMQNKSIEKIVAGSIKEIEQMLLSIFRLDKGFVAWYSKKELKRFRNILLYDPINRVAREPLRKLASNERLIGAAQLCLSSSIIPKNIMLGIMAAFCYENTYDPDYNIKYLAKALEPKDFLRLIIRLRPGEPLFEILLKDWKNNILILKGLRE